MQTLSSILCSILIGKKIDSHDICNSALQNLFQSLTWHCAKFTSKRGLKI